MSDVFLSPKSRVSVILCTICLKGFERRDAPALRRRGGLVGGGGGADAAAGGDNDRK